METTTRDRILDAALVGFVENGLWVMGCKYKPQKKRAASLNLPL